MLLLSQPKSDHSKIQSDGSERRRGLRIDQSRPVKVFEASTSRYFAGETCDVSATGLRIQLPHSMPVRPGKVITIHVGLSDKGQPLANRRAMIPAKIVWIEHDHSATTPKVMAGVEFVSSIAAHLDAA